MPLPPPSLAEEAPRERSAVYSDADQPEEAYLQPASVQLSHLPQSQQSPAALLQGRGYEDSSLPPHPGLAEHALPPSSPAASRPLVSGPKPPTPPQHHRGAAPAAGTARTSPDPAQGQEGLGQGLGGSDPGNEPEASIDSVLNNSPPGEPETQATTLGSILDADGGPHPDSMPPTDLDRNNSVASRISDVR